jgi:hypothetical protein
MGNTTRKIISEKILFGPKEENELTVANEIIAGTRPKKWNVAGHPDHDVWVSMIELKQENRQKELIKAITPHVYPTSQIFHGQITIEEYIIDIADWLTKEMLDRRMPREVLPLFAELAVLRR